MNNLETFRPFAKSGSKQDLVRTEKNCVIYTRVSTKEQAEHNMSLETQRKACEQFALRNNYSVLSSFGGTYESAKTDERKEFKKMLDYVRKNKEKISYIIVYSVDRFSRTGANGMYIASQLRKQGVSVLAVSQHSDTSTAGGRLQQNIHFIFSEYDNELRRDKAVIGMKEKVAKGYWIGKQPFGYDNFKSNGEQKLVINDNGKLIRKAFEWKANENLTNIEIIERLKKYGLTINPQSLWGIFRNPFYCGMVAHSMLEGGIIEGRHEPLISKELFLRVNEKFTENHHIYKHAKESQPHPLRRFVKCSVCGTSFAGYTVKKKGIHYYKCAKKGCKCNRNASKMHEMFLLFLSQYIIDEKFLEPMKEILIDIHNELQEKDEDDIIALNHSLTAINNKIETFEERYGLGEISKEIYLKYTAKYRAEKLEIEKELAKFSDETSNLNIFVKDSLEIANNVQEIWKLGDYHLKEQLQYLIFPNGILYDREINGFRTQNVNSIFRAIACVSEKNNTDKIEDNGASATLSTLVGVAGFEPATPWSQTRCANRTALHPESL